MAPGIKTMEVLLVAAIAFVGVTTFVHMGDEQPVDVEIIIEGIGETDPIPGTYSIEKGNELTINMQAAEGWLLSMVTIDGSDTLIGEHQGSITLTVDSDMTIVVHFISPEVSIPGSVELPFTGEEVVAYVDNQYYTVSGGSATDVGEYEATLSLRNPDFCHWSDMTDEDKIIAWSIVPRTITAADFAPIGDVTYTGQRILPDVVPLEPLTLDDISYEYGENIHAGIGTVDIVADGNFTGNVTLEFDILRKGLVVSIFVDGDREIAYGSEIPRYGYSFTGFVNGDDETVLTGEVTPSCGYSVGSDVGEYVIDASGVSSDDYDITYDLGKLTVVKADYDMSGITFTDRSYEYDGTVRNIAISGTLPTGIDGEQVSVSYSAGSKDVVYRKEIVATFSTDNDNYNIPAPMKAYLTVYGKEVVVSAEPKSKFYGDNDPEFTTTVTGLIGDDTIDYEVQREQGETYADDGYAITPVGERTQGNYTVLYEPSILIVQKRPITFTSGSAEKTDDGLPLTNPSVSITGKGLAFDDNVSFNVTGSQNGAGWSWNEFSYVLDNDENYEVTVTKGTLVVNGLRGAITIKADSVSKMYDGTPLTFGTSYTTKGFSISGMTLPSTDRVEVTFDSNSTVTNVGSVANKIKDIRFMRGTEDITASYANVDIVGVDGTLTVEKRSVYLQSASKTWVYDGTDHSEHTIAAEYGDGFVDGEGVTYDFSGSITDVGSVLNEFTVRFDTGTRSENYDVRTFFGMLTITPMELFVDANDASKTYGDADPELTATVKDNKGVTVTDSKITYDFTREVGEDVGSYKITPVGSELQGNYRIHYIDGSGKLSIEKATLTVTADDKTKVYGDVDPKLTATISGYRNGDTASIFIGGLTIEREQGENAGRYVITPSYADPLKNYDPVFRTGYLIIEKLDISNAKVSLSNDGELTYTGSEQTMGVTSISVTPLTRSTGIPASEYTVSGNKGTDVGEYTLTVTMNADSMNHKGSASANWTIVPMDISRCVVTIDGTYTYNGQERTVSFDVGNEDITLVEDEDYRILSGDKGKDAGKYELTLEGIGNYSGTAKKEWVIDTAGVWIRTMPAEKVYDGTPLTRTDGYSVEGVIPGDEYIITITGSIVDVGVADNTYTFEWVDENDVGNYTISASLGRLTVKPLTLLTEYFEPIPAMIYIGGQIKPGIALSETGKAAGLNMDRDCSVSYGSNDKVGKGSGSVIVSGKGNSTTLQNGTDVPVELNFDIYSGVTVYVTKDGNGNTYSDWTLSEFGAPPRRPLYDLNGIVSGTSQTAEMLVDNLDGYDGMSLGIAVKGLERSGESNELDKHIIIMVKRGSETYSCTLYEASNDVLLLGDITNGDDIPLEVTLKLDEQSSGDTVQGMSLNFTLAVGILYPPSEE